MNLQKLLFKIPIALAPILVAGCFQESFMDRNQSFFNTSTHSEVAPPPTLSSSEELLFIGLKPYLGKGATFDTSSEYLNLISQGHSLFLRDSAGRTYTSPEIKISWGRVLLNEPYEIARKVLGPFSSFESAEKVSLELSNLGIQSKIAHPFHWEVWVSEETQLPKQFLFSLFRAEITSIIKPILVLPKGDSTFLEGPIEINAPNGLLLDGGIYQGPFRLQKDAYGTWTLIEVVPLEKYLHGVVPHEIGHKAPPAALGAQAVLARTWAVANSHRYRIDGYHLCSNTQCQVYKDPSQISLEILSAIEVTEGKFLSWKGEPIHAVYHASNGGITASIAEAWFVDALPYFNSKLDGSLEWVNSFVLPFTDDEELEIFLDSEEGAYGTSHRLFRWKRRFTAEELQKALKTYEVFDSDLKEIKVSERGLSGRVIWLEMIGEDKTSKVDLRLDEIRRVLRNLPSTLFLVKEIEEGVWEFTGAGFGHGVGLSQAGAIDLALNGWTTDEILSHYYPETMYGPLQNF